MPRTLIAVAVTVMLASVSGSAHHSYADFNSDRTVSIEGDVEGIVFANPHVLLKVRDRDAQVHVAIWQAAYQLARSGVLGTTLKIGDHVVVSGAPSRDDAVHILSLIKEIRRPSDAWVWRRD